MNIQTLKSLARVRGLSQSDLARAAGVSRQTVSFWFSQTGDVNLFAKNLERLAEFLGVAVEDLSRPLPILGNAEERNRWATDLLWDRLYPDLEKFVDGLIRGQPEALARLVQVCGLYQSEKIAGKQIWRKFPVYRRHIHPAYRRQAEVVWKTAKSLNQH